MYTTLPCRVNPADLTVEEWDSDHPRYQEAMRGLAGSMSIGEPVHILVALDDAGALLGTLKMGVQPCPLAGSCAEAIIIEAVAPCGTDLGTALYEEAALLARSMGCVRLLFPVNAGIGLSDAMRLGLDPCNDAGMCYVLTLDSSLLPVVEWEAEVDGYLL